MATTLFTIERSEGTITCTEPQKAVYLLTFNFGPDNRMTTTFCQAMLLALDIIELKYPPGVVVTTSGIPKFYSNGLDLQHAVETKGFWEHSLFALFKRFLTYPLPTVALINGHAFAGGLMTSMYHDYRVFNPSRGFLCLNEIQFGATLKPAMSSIFREKLPNPRTYRSMVLEAYRFNAQEALDQGIVDVLGGLEEAVALIEQKKLTALAGSGVYGQLRREMLRQTYGILESCANDEAVEIAESEKEMKRREDGQKRIEEWKADRGKASKL